MTSAAQPPPSLDVASALEIYELQDVLDEAAQSLLYRVDPARALEVIEDVVTKGDVRNPSAFVAKALHRFPQLRGAEAPRAAAPAPGRAPAAAASPADAALARHPALRAALDEAAVRRLRGADPDRAVEVVEELAAKSDVQNPSAFVVKSLASYPHKRGHQGEVEGLLAQHPEVEASLDEAALTKLKSAVPARAVEIMEDLMAKGDVQNPSAFVVKALTAYPLRRGTPPKTADQLLAAHPDIRDALDEAAMAKLREAEPARAVEIIEDIASRGDVRNPSAFVAKALQLYPHKRGGSSEVPAAGFASSAPGFAHAAQWSGGPASRAMSGNPALASGLDAEALTALSQADPDRAVEIVRDLASKWQEIRNPSAFVVQALKSFPQRRGDPLDVESALARRPRVRAALDETAMQKLWEADPARAVEVIEDVAARSDVYNPSAFVTKALAAHPQKRGHEDMAGGAFEPPAAKRFRPGFAAPAGAPRAFGAGASWAASRPRPQDSLDEQARRQLAAANPARAEEILEELAEKGGQIRNASAFVAKALHQYPLPRGRRAA